MRIDRRLLGWGAFFVIAGAIPLAVQAGVVSRAALDGWPALWPLLLIGAGLGLVLRGTPARGLGGFVTVLTAGAMVGGLLATGFAGFPAFGACGSGSGGTAFQQQSGTLSDPASMRVEFNCGALDIHPADGTGWTFSGTGPSGRTPSVETDASRVAISGPRDTFTLGDAAWNWHVIVPRAPTLDLSVTLNAGSATVDLSGTKLGGATMTLNAGSLDVDASNAATLDSFGMTVNAGSLGLSLPAATNAARITVNAGSANVCVPADAAFRISWGGALAGNNFDGLGLVKVDDNHWETPGVATASHAIDLTVSANAGSMNLVRGGSCHA